MQVTGCATLAILKLSLYSRSPVMLDATLSGVEMLSVGFPKQVIYFAPANDPPETLKFVSPNADPFGTYNDPTGLL